MKKLLFFIFIFSLLLYKPIIAQQYGNEWINYTQSYYKVYIHENGVYRINYSALLNAGFPVGSVNPRNIQVFNKGVEQYIFIRGESDNIFNPGDYIEFYAEKNDGSLDTPLYKNPEGQANKAYSLFSDSSVYFITWNTSFSNHRMQPDNDVNFASYNPAPYIFKTSRENYTSVYFAGETNSGGITDPEYTANEGWFDNGFNVGQSITKNIPTTNKYASGPVASVEFVVLGQSNFATAVIDHHLNISFAGLTIDTLFSGYKVLRYNYQVPVSQLGSSTTPFVFSSVNDLGVGSDRNTVAYIEVKYPHTLNLGGNSSFYFSAVDGLQAKSLLNFTNFNVVAGDTSRLYDITNHRRIKVVYDGTAYKCLLTNSGNEKYCYLTSDNSINSINKIYPVNGDAKFINYQTIANTEFTDYLIVTHPSLLNEAENYKNYRNTTGYHAMTLNVEHLYDQFGYGILKSSFSIRNFVRFAFHYFGEKPRGLFLIGKGYRAASDGSLPQYRKDAYHDALTLVPSFGYPPSDLLFSQGITDSLYKPAVGTGRLSARTPEDVAIYLDKIIQFELAQQTPEEWMKTILHFGGGGNAQEQTQLAAYLNHYKQTIEDPLFGGEVQTFLKTSSAPMQANLSDSLKTLINNGVTMMTFFGHAASTGFDVSVDVPSEYQNYGKYPFILGNSCWAGDIFLDTYSTSEEFILIEDKGAIGFLASISLGIPWALNVYSDELYHQISYKSYGKPIGEIIKNTIDSLQGPNLVLKENCLTMVLHGDPAIILNSFAKPDYMITPPNVYFSPPQVTSDLDSFNIHIVSTNIGRAINDSIIVQTTRTFPNGVTTVNYFNKIKAPLFKDTLTIKIPVDVVNGPGLNKFRIYLDCYQTIEELSEINNITEVQLMIKSSDIIPVYPYKYAVIPALPVTLKASTSDAFIGPFDYEFQLDTTDAFNSPVKQTFHINQSGGVVPWTPTYPITTDSIVYFWRVSIDSNAQHDYNWRESSFQYIMGKRGWGQAHFFQFKNDDYQYVAYNKPQRRFDFVNDEKSITCQTGFYPYIAWQDEYYKVNNVMKFQWAYMGPSGNGMIIAVIDSVSGNPWLNYNMPQPETEAGWEFSCNTFAEREAMRNFINNTVPDGNYILAYSHRNHNAESYSEDLYQSFESFGSSQIRTLPNNIPYIIFGQKGGAIGSAHELQGSAISSIIKLYDSVSSKWNEGYIKSELIGPASSWGSLHWRKRPLESLNTDSAKLFVLGIKFNGQTDTLIKNLPPDSSDIYNLSTRINAAVYPYLKLAVSMRDDSLHTPAQMLRWQVLYEGVPETALNPSFHFIFYNDTIAEGENILFSTATKNISDYDMDSLLIKYWVVDKNMIIHPLGSFRHRPHPSGDILIDTITFSTSNLGGLNSLWIEVNPDYDQIEQTHFNNIGEIKFLVDRDRINPMLDVTFDGVHIFDGDIVSSKPEIQISLKDENKYLALNDTACFRVYLQAPGSSTKSRVYFMQNGLEKLQFIPASLPNNSCKIIYNPEFLTDGVYQFFVEARDISHNESGSNDYSISFEVINKPSITHVMNWPNPFSTATHFVFTLTGSEVPTYFKIQILTVTGKVVREIDLTELGPIHIGRNITEYAWNGTDEFGDRLANGVYLYRVVTRLNNEKLELRETQADQYFKKEFGKMYLIGN
ncbi:MAG TPA: C25 family cysteine peptidase [Bacteroidales bacterium]|nr:C25 family cysteine peptidase [Bacteroidales bacterium]